MCTSSEVTWTGRGKASPGRALEVPRTLSESASLPHPSALASLPRVERDIDSAPLNVPAHLVFRVGLTPQLYISLLLKKVYDKVIESSFFIRRSWRKSGSTKEGHAIWKKL